MIKIFKNIKVNMRKEKAAAMVFLMTVVIIAIAIFSTFMTLRAKTVELDSPDRIVVTQDTIQNYLDKEAVNIFDSQIITSPDGKTYTLDNNPYNFIFEENRQLYNKYLSENYKTLPEYQTLKDTKIIQSIITILITSSTFLIILFGAGDSKETKSNMKQSAITAVLAISSLIAMVSWEIVTPNSVGIDYTEFTKLQESKTIAPTILNLEYDATEDMFLYNNMKIKASALPDSIEKVDQEVIYKDGSLYKK